MPGPMDSIMRRINMTVGACRILNRIIEGTTPTLQVVVSGGAQMDGMTFMQQYGFVSKPLPGADAISLFFAGDHNRGTVIASNDQRYRPKKLGDGEVAIYHKSGTTVILKNDGSVEINPSDRKCVLNGNLKVDGNIDTTGDVRASGDVTAGSVSLQSHKHSGGYQNQPTGGPL